MLFGSSEGREASRALAQFGGLGISLSLGVVLFWYLGYRLDLWLQTTPVLQAMGCLVGAAVALYKLVHDVTRWSD